MTPKEALTVCPRCGGSGMIQDEAAVGREMRKRRESVPGLSAREVARRMGFSAAYVSDLERGRRHWTPEVTRKYLAAVERGR